MKRKLKKVEALPVPDEEKFYENEIQDVIQLDN